MTKKKILFLLPVLLLSACGQKTSSTPSGSMPSSSAPAASTPSEPAKESASSGKDYSDVDGDPKPLYLPQEAPEDYRDVDALTLQEDPFLAYSAIDHSLANSNYVARMTGTADAGMVYSQDISSVKVYDGTTGFSHVVAASDSLFQGFSVNTAEQRLEDVTQGFYGYRQNAEGAQIDIGENGLGTVSAWSEKDASIFSRTTYLAKLGHDLFGLTNYYVPSADYIQSGVLESFTSEDYLFSFKFETKAGVYYREEQQHMINLQGATVDIVTLGCSVRVDAATLRPLELVVDESYAVKALGLSINVTGHFTTTFEYFEGEDMPEDVRPVYDDALAALK